MNDLEWQSRLLKEDGVIFVSIDDSEQAYLKVLMDEIFGEENFIACVPAILNPSGRQVNTEIALTSWVYFNLWWCEFCAWRAR